MLIYNELKNKPREFLAATGLKLDEFEKLSPAFQTAYEQKYPPDLTQEGKTRQRQIGGGATGALPQSEDKLFFILVYQKTNPLQTMHGLQFGLSQPQAHAWMYRLLPVLQQALRDLGEAPERDARRVATSDLARTGGPALTIDGSERRRGRVPLACGSIPEACLGTVTGTKRRRPVGPHGVTAALCIVRTPSTQAVQAHVATSGPLLWLFPTTTACSHSRWLRPRRHAEHQDLAQCPDMVGQPRGHGRRTRPP